MANVGPFTSVRPKMCLEVALETARLSANAALEVLLSVYPLHCIRWRPVSAALDPNSRTVGNDGATAGRRVTVRIGYADSFSFIDLQKTKMKKNDEMKNIKHKIPSRFCVFVGGALFIWRLEFDGWNISLFL